MSLIVNGCNSLFDVGVLEYLGLFWKNDIHIFDGTYDIVSKGKKFILTLNWYFVFVFLSHTLI